MSVSRPAKFYESELNKIEKKFGKLFETNKPDSLYEPCSYIMQSGGKRLRPLLVILSAKAMGAKTTSVYNAALAVELLHNFTLVHDDIMDNADKRRGRPTLHKKYDVNAAILAGDNLLAMAYRYLLKDCKDNDKAVLNTFTTGVIEVCEGQSLDKDFELRNKVTIDEYYEMIGKKTAALLKMCCSIGARLGGGSEQEIKAFEKYGENLGLAFQIQDDYLDVAGDEKKFGKKIGGDLREGKKTFMFIKAYEKAAGKDKQALNQFLSNKGIPEEMIAEFKQLYIKLGVIDEARKEIERFTQTALRQIRNLSGEENREIFNWLANSLIQRNK
ncbi:MAG TPA: polyprenyl synthetase family protein [Ignavibacteriales bacterium]|nr:polyprenyl synthetase family protein [Ignavibacteriales bacterium]